MIIIETCPKCGHDLQDLVIATYPPIPKKECWNCGMTRALVSVAYLDFYGAWHYNRAVVVVAPLLVYLWLRWVYNLVKFSK